MTYQVGVVGASGYAGAELLRLLASHPDLEVGHVTADSNAGVAVCDLYPSLRSASRTFRYASLDSDALAGLDAVFIALPHGESQRLVPGLVGTVAHIIDLGADFRLPAVQYETWYGRPHGAPEILDLFAFGLVELYRDEIRTRKHVANPGCYPTAAGLALAPLVAAGMVEATGIVVDACSGVSGAGRSLVPTSLFSEANEQVSAYGLLTHRHTAEMEQALGHVAGRSVQVLFTPHLAPMSRGILATCYAHPSTRDISTAALLALYREHYAGEPFVEVVDEPSGSKATSGSNAVHVTVRYDERTATVLAVAAEDNLVKGAAGQAIQNANLLLGLPETRGLTAVGVAP